MPPQWAGEPGEPYSSNELRRSISELETQKGYDSQKELANSLNVTPRTIQRWKSGDIDVNNSTVRDKIIRRIRYHNVGRFEPDISPEIFYRTIYSGDRNYEETQTWIEVLTYMTTIDPHDHTEVRKKWTEAVNIVYEEFGEAVPRSPSASEQNEWVDRQAATFPLWEIMGQCLVKNRYGEYYYQIDFKNSELNRISQGEYIA